MAEPFYSCSKAAATTRALQWASLTLARLLSLEVSLLLGVLLPGGLMSVDLGSPNICGVSLHSHPWQSSKEDTTSVTSSGSLDGDPGSLWSLYTSFWGPTSWMVGTSTSGSSFSNLCQQPQQTICSASFCPCSEACWNILWSIMR